MEGKSLPLLFPLDGGGVVCVLGVEGGGVQMTGA